MQEDDKDRGTSSWETLNEGNDSDDVLSDDSYVNVSSRVLLVVTSATAESIIKKTNPLQLVHFFTGEITNK